MSVFDLGAFRSGEGKGRENRLRALCSILFGSLLCCGPAAAQDDASARGSGNFVDDVTNTGTSAAAFLQIGVGSRAQAMGNASAAVTRDATSLFWNPAGAAQLEGTVNIALDHTEWFADTNLDFVGAVFSIPRVGSIGLSVMNFQMIDQQPVRTILQPDGTGEYYDASDLALAATYAVALTDRFAAGITARYVREALWHETASTAAFDFGILYRTNLRGLLLAASISNFGGDMKLGGRDLVRPYDDDPGNFSNDRLNTRLDTDAYSIPLYFRFGLGYDVDWTELHRFTIAADLLHPSDNSEAVNLGAEYTFANTLSLRGGMVALFETDRTGGSTLGVGVHRKLLGGLRLGADYTYADWGILEGTQRVTISIGY